MRAVNRGRHADDVLDADTPLAGRPSTVRSRLDRPVGKVAGVLCGDALNDRARRDHQVYGVVRPDDATATSREQSHGTGLSGPVYDNAAPHRVL
jgi:hypothetical protein